jgi:uncharacterized protein
MKTLPAKARAVERLFVRLEKEMDSFRKESGIYCPTGCGACCQKPDIEATPLEFLPFALHVFDNATSNETLIQLKEKSDSICLVFRPHLTSFGGLCNAYPHRGMICRLFGYSARRNKEGKKELVTCRIIKDEQKTNFESAISRIETGLGLPVMSDYYSQLSSIDPSLVEFYSYRRRRRIKV